MARALSKAVRNVRGHNLRISDEASALAVDGIGPAVMKVHLLSCLLGQSGPDICCYAVTALDGPSAPSCRQEELCVTSSSTLLHRQQPCHVSII